MVVAAVAWGWEEGGFSSMEAGVGMKRARRYSSGAWEKVGDLEKVFDREASKSACCIGRYYTPQALSFGGGRGCRGGQLTIPSPSPHTGHASAFTCWVGQRRAANKRGFGLVR